MKISSWPLVNVVFSGTLIFLMGFSTVAGRNERFIEYKADPSKTIIRTYYKSDSGKPIKNLLNLYQMLAAKQEKLLFAMNAGMYMEGNIPLGLYVENGKVIRPLNTAKAAGNFYLKPNGVFYISKANKAGICKTEDYSKQKDIAYATQSGPMLLINGEINPLFTKGSANVYVRNGVGVFPDGKLLFVKSKLPVNFYDFANYFKE